MQIGKNRENGKKKKHVWLKVVLVLSLLIALCAAGAAGYWWFEKGGEHWYRYTYHKTHEPFTLRKKTSTDAIYSEARMKKWLSGYELADGTSIADVMTDSYVIPGLKATRTVLGRNAHEADICASMTPQGVAVAENYLLISAYCNTKIHNSVIYVMDKTSHEFIKEIVLPDKSHVGSIAYDPEHRNIWVCCHDNAEGVAYVNSFSMQEMEDYSFDDGFNTIEYSQICPIVTQKRASFLSYQDGSLYIGYFKERLDASSTVQRFEINSEGGLDMVDNPVILNEGDPEKIILPSSLASIDGGAQGFASNDELAVVMTSGGSVNDSKLMMFANTLDDEGNLNATAENALMNLNFPVMAEQIALDGHDLYVCFESAAYAYRARKCVHVDRIIVLHI